MSVATETAVVDRSQAIQEAAEAAASVLKDDRAPITTILAEIELGDGYPHARAWLDYYQTKARSDLLKRLLRECKVGEPGVEVRRFHALTRTITVNGQDAQMDLWHDLTTMQTQDVEDVLATYNQRAQQMLAVGKSIRSYFNTLNPQKPATFTFLDEK